MDCFVECLDNNSKATLLLLNVVIVGLNAQSFGYKFDSMVHGRI